MMRRHEQLIILLGLALSVACAACGPAAEKTRLVTHPEGFSISLPGSWEAKVIDKAYILAAPRDPAGDPSFVLVQPFFLKTDSSSLDWLQANLSKLAGFFTQAAMEKSGRLRAQPDEAAARLSFVRNGVPGMGLALCSIQERSGVLYVAGCRKEEFEARKKGLVAMLRSFRFESPAAGAAQAQPATAYVQFQDPTEQAFSLDVPKGWQVQGGTFRRASVDLVHVLHAASPDGRVRILFNDPDLPIFTMPNQTLAWAGFTEGSWYSPGYGVRMMVKRYLPGALFLREYLGQKYAPSLAGFSIIDEKDRPDIVQDFNRIYSQFQGYGVSFILRAGEAAFRFEQDGAPSIGYGLAVTQAVQSAAMPGGTWSVALLIVTTTPEAEAGVVRETAVHMFESIRVNPQWAAGQQQLAGNVSQIVTQTSREIAGIINDSYWYRQGVMDNVHRKFSNMILGVTDAVDPATGDTYKVEAGHNYYWTRSGTNQVAGTATYSRPDIDFSPLIEY